MKLLVRAFSLLVIALFMASCQQSDKSESTESTDEATTKAETPANMAVINPNLASEEELKGLGISDELVSQIMEARPFITMNDLDVLVSNDMDAAAKEALYLSLIHI